MAKVTAEEKEQTRERILFASRKIFRENGFNKAQLKTIAKEACIGVSTLYGYYPSKHELFVSAFIELYMTRKIDNDKITQALEKGLSKGIFELLIVERNLDIDKDLDILREFYIKSLADERENICKRKQQNTEQEHLYIKTILEIYERTNMRLCAFSLNHLADCIVTIMSHISIEYFLFREYSYEDVERMVTEQLEVLFVGKYKSI